MSNLAGLKTFGDLLNVHQAGRVIGRSGQSVKLYCRAEGLPHRRVSGRIVIVGAELAEWAERPEILDMLARGETMKIRARRKSPRVDCLATA